MSAAQFYVKLPGEFMTMRKMIFISVLVALSIEALCVLMLMSGGVFFGPVAYVGFALLWPSLYLCNLILGDGGFMFAPVPVFFQFFIPTLWILAKKYGQEAA
jgi:hypothetical protein